MFASDVADGATLRPGCGARCGCPRPRARSGSLQFRFADCAPAANPAYRAGGSWVLSAADRAGAGTPGALSSNSNAYRVVFGEADLLPALIIDRYADFVVMQTLDQGMDRATAKSPVAWTNSSRRGPWSGNDAAVRNESRCRSSPKVLSGELPETVPVRLNGLSFEADLLRGQKTGVYLDQRENYLAAAKYAHGRALDCFTSSGGFAMHIAARCERGGRRTPPPPPTLRGEMWLRTRSRISSCARQTCSTSSPRKRTAAAVIPRSCSIHRPSQSRGQPWKARLGAIRRSTSARFDCSRLAAFWSPAPVRIT